MTQTNLSTIGPVVLIGAGKMGMAMARGWLAAWLKPDNLVLVDPNAAPEVAVFAKANGVRLQAAATNVVPRVLILAVKPQIMGAVLAGLAPVVREDTLVLSIAAGVSLATLTNGLGTQRVIRTMPNTPAQIGKGITGAVPAAITPDDKAIAEALLSAAGQVVWFDDEAKLDAVTAVSGSGPAYVFYLVEALAEAARRQGFDDEQAEIFARQTVIGSAALLEADPASAATLRKNVTSPNGTTAAALAVLMADDGLVALMNKAVDAARKRSEELGRG
ncbi:pyrroline-5-carboxylate reductase [Devosia sp.]|uniref:pyrroline-5-carboxylate reductase n=1 Tax=Devosia sp. TaxID=1871048 RepID=UPI00326625A6